MLYGISLVLLGILTVPSLFLSKKPEAKETLEKIQKFEPIIGLIFTLLGVIGLVQCFLSLGILTQNPIGWMTWVATCAVQTALAFLLSYNKINELLFSNNPEFQVKSVALRLTLTPMKGQLAIISIGVGIWSIVASIIL